MAGESRNIFLTLHRNNTSWELRSRRWLSVLFYVSRGITQHAPRSAITGKTPDSTVFSRLDGHKITYLFAKDCISFLTISRSHRGAENLPVQSPGLLYCKHSGNLPEGLSSHSWTPGSHHSQDKGNPTRQLLAASPCNSRNAVSTAEAPERITATLKPLKVLIYLFVFVFPLFRGYHPIAAHLSAQKTTATRQPCHCLATRCLRFSSVPSPALCWHCFDLFTATSKYLRDTKHPYSIASLL